VNKIFKTILIICALIAPGQLFASGTISKITVIGNKRVENSTIQSYLGIKIGSSYDEAVISSGIKNLYLTGLFENISTKITEGNLIVTVKENPFISKVSFKGNYKVGSKLLSKELLTKAGESLDNLKISEDVKKIQKIYQSAGRFLINVTPQVEHLENNRVSVTFEIAEGPKTGIQRIYFIGNEHYRDPELKNVILTRESRWFRFLEKNDTYDPYRIEYDKELLTEFYQSVGFADFRVISATAELSPTKEYFTVTYSLDEGDKYKIGTIEVKNKLKDIDETAIRKLIKVKTGEVFNMKNLENTAEKITAYLASNGYPQLEVHPNTDNKDQVNKLVDVEFVVDYAQRVFVNQINIEGNLKTQDKVIRREFKISEGDLFNRAYIDKGEQNLRNLDYFEKISTNITPTNQPDKYNVDITVQEKSTSSIGFDFGYNTANGPFGQVSFLERNLIGTGKILNLGAYLAKNTTNYYLGITEPYFLDKNLALSFNFFKNHSGKSSGWQKTEQDYTQNTIGFKPSLGYEITEDLSHEVEYVIKRDSLSAPRDSSFKFITEQLGKFTTSAISQTITYDKTDSRIIPKNGYIVSGTQGYAGIGGDNHYIKHEVDGKYFYSFLKNRFTVKLAGSAGNITGTQGRTVRISDRFNIGEYTLRGFEMGGVGPRDKRTKEGLGGQNFYSFTTELNFPLGLPDEFGLSGAVFADLGSVWGVKLKRGSDYTKDQFYNDKSLRASVGFGFIWITRFAPIRVDWGFPVKKQRYDKTQHFHIKFSTHF
jgi:outer membrane protein insertion porin family